MNYVDTINNLRAIEDIPVVIVNGKGLIFYVNEEFLSVFGWTKGAIMGASLTSIIPKAFHHAHNFGFSQFVSTEKSKILNKPLKLKAIKKDGTVFDAEHFIIAEKIQDQWIIGATIRPLL